jgi:carboxyl-terminal processing protease
MVMKHRLHPFHELHPECIAEVREALTDLKENQGAEDLILDLRSNPGGLVNEAVEIVNLFVKPGQEVVSTRGRQNSTTPLFRSDKSPVAPDMPVVVLINRGICLASEHSCRSTPGSRPRCHCGGTVLRQGLVPVARPLSYKGPGQDDNRQILYPQRAMHTAVDFSNRIEKTAAWGQFPIH